MDNKMMARISAEGLNVGAISKLIVADSTASKTGGCVNMGKMSSQAVVDMFHGKTQYRGGYLYQGWSCTVNGISEDRIFRKQWVNDVAPVVISAEGMLLALNRESVDSVVKFTNSLELSETHTLVKTRNGLWLYTLYSDIIRKQEERIQLTPGIRQRVAEKLGCRENDTFNTAFDMAVQRVMG